MKSDSPHILVTGTTRGIGAEILRELKSRGARVIGHGSRDVGDNETVGADLSQEGAADRAWKLVGRGRENGMAGGEPC